MDRERRGNDWKFKSCVKIQKAAAEIGLCFLGSLIWVTLA